uniref:Coiled-coil domain-containing protein 13 n=1 Tax=Trypanosoma vivax (strain Y486) TaxID=1055687 RepID=G0TVG2_TRYVY|nr:conserved hypothetical protein [Trypanosoma vivax Y486]
MLTEDVRDGSGDPIIEEIKELHVILQNGKLTNGVLEGKYLNQLRRVRQLSVQLDSERTRSRQLASRVEALEEVIQNQERRPEVGQTANRVKCGGRRRDTEVSDSESGDGGQHNVSVLRERLERAYVQMNEAKVQLDEHKKEMLRLHKILQQETGASSEELEALLRGEVGSSVGWRGRAQQIVLLKGKVKELKRALASAVAVDKIGNETAAPVAANSVGFSALSVNTGSHSTGVVSTRCRDVDDVARERVVELQNRRLLQQRELQDELTQRTTELDALKQRLEASQARHANLESANRQLREHLQLVLQKTENDNDLIDAYREEIIELQRTQAQLVRCENCHEDRQQPQPVTSDGETRQKVDTLSTRSFTHLPVNPTSVADAKIALAAADGDAVAELSRLRVENAELRNALERCKTVADGKQGKVTAPLEHSEHSSEDPEAHAESALILAWLRSIASRPTAMNGETTQQNIVPTQTGCNWQAHVVDALRGAFCAVVFHERQREEEKKQLSECYKTIQRLQNELKRNTEKSLKGKRKVCQEGVGIETTVTTDEADDLVSLVLRENAAMKQHLKMMQKLMEKERAAYESLRTTLEASGEGLSDTSGAYIELKRQYEDLRTAFNHLQAMNSRAN